MSTAAELYREVACAYNTDNVAVFLAEQSHSAELLGFFNRHFAGIYLDSLKNFLVNKLLDVHQLLGCERLKVSEVKTENRVVYKLTSLLNVVAEHLAESRLEQVCSGVVSHDIGASV